MILKVFKIPTKNHFVFIFFSIVTIIACVKSSGHFPVSYILMHISRSLGTFSLAFNNYAGIKSHHSVFPLLSSSIAASISVSINSGPSHRFQHFLLFLSKTAPI